jgi:16S rRNA (cytosine1402-N4)-methyltransferase
VTGGHSPVLIEEVVAALNINRDGIYIDATFGRGGHSRAILDRLGPDGRLLALDRDPEAVETGRHWQDARFHITHAAFGQLAKASHAHGIGQAHGILLDLGISSPQLDTPERGFSFRHDAPLDMRMDTTRGMTAAEWLGTADEDEIAQVVREYGEERFAKQVARAIVTARNRAPIVTTGQLAGIAAQAVRTRERGQHPATRTFQAVRIFVNRELEELAQALPQAVGLLRPKGRLAVISFHSLEDRLVKQFMRDESRGPTIPAEIPLKDRELPHGRLRVIGKPIRPSEQETRANPRARSAVLRVAERREGTC